MKGLIHSLPPPHTLLPASPQSPSPPKHSSPPLSRRHFLSLALISLPLHCPSTVSAAASDSPSLCPATAAVTSEAFLDISIDGSPVGRITIGLFGSAAPAGAARFVTLASSVSGVSYRRKEFVKIAPTYIQHAGVRSYGADADLARRRSGGDLAADDLLSEWSAATAGCGGVRSAMGTVGIVVRNPARPPPSTRIVARKGRIEMEEEEGGPAPNGTEFVIATRDSPEMDELALAVGRVITGMDVVERIAGVSSVRDNTGSPYFRLAKLIGDKRAVVAERGFNRPYSKVLVTNCGLLTD